MGTMYRQAQLYSQTQVQHDIRDKSPIELIVLYYDTAILKLKVAKDRMEAGDLIGKGEALSHAIAIIAELRAVLDKGAGGDIARKLDELYTYMLNQLTVANFQNDGQRVGRIIDLLDTLHVSWKAVAQQPAGTGQPSLPRNEPVSVTGRAVKG